MNKKSFISIILLVGFLFLSFAVLIKKDNISLNNELDIPYKTKYSEEDVETSIRPLVNINSKNDEELSLSSLIKVKDFQAKDNLQMIAEKTLSFSLKYDANGGSEAPSNQTATSTTSSYNFIISDKEPTRSGYEFKGWSTSSTDPSPNYHVGETINVTGTTTLYAVWEAIPRYYNLKKIFVGLDEIDDNFYMDYTATAGDKEISTRLDLKNAEFIDEDTMTITWKAPYYYNTGYNNQVVIKEHSDVIGYSYHASSSSGSTDKNIIRFTLSSMLSGATRTITNYYQKDISNQTTYLVKWYNADTEKEIKDSDIRNGIIGNMVTVTEEDKIIDEYIFDETNEKNVLSKELTNSETILKLYFKKKTDTPENTDNPENPGASENPEIPNDPEDQNKPSTEIENPITGDNLILTILTFTISIITMTYFCKKITYKG